MNETPNESADELTSALRKALVEIGILIPRTAEEVTLAEACITDGTTPEQVASSFEKLERMLDSSSTAPAFMRLRESIADLREGGLSMAARKGATLDAKTRAKIEETIARITGKSTQT